LAPAENGTAPASFALSGTAEAGSTVEVFEGSLSMGTTRTHASGAWSKALSNVAGGTHTYTARANDDAGSTSALSGPRTLTVDTTAPAVNSVSPADGTLNVAVASKVVAAFSEAMTAATIDGTTFTLVQQGGVTPVAATVSYDAQSKEAILTPDADLQAGTNYTATIKTGVKDLAGNALANDEVWSFSTADATPPADTTPPETTMDSGPFGTVASASATFAFSASEAGSSFECSLDGAAFAPCASPKDYTGLSDGSHTLRVRATDAAGNADATPVERNWTVSTAPTQKTRNVLAFDGVDDWVSIKSSSWLNLTPSTQRTYEAWIKTGQNVSARQFVYEEGGDPNGFSVEISGGRLYFNAWSNTNGWRPLSASAPVNPDAFYRVAGVYDQPGGQVRLYVDGALAGSSSGAGPMYEHSDAVALGGISGATRDHANKIVASGSNFGGRLGEFRAWDHARSQTQISGAMEANLSGTEPGLIALYKVGEGGGTTLKDSGPRKIDGTISGAAWETLTYTPIG
jgi:hypothetical protein